MSVAVAVLERLEGPAPEWTIEDKETLEVMRSLTSENRRVEEVKGEVVVCNPRYEQVEVDHVEVLRQVIEHFDARLAQERRRLS